MNYTINKSQFSMKVINKYIEVFLKFAKRFLSSFCVFLSSKKMKKLAEIIGGILHLHRQKNNLNIGIYRKITISPLELFLTGQ